jgi:hypothetical protein
MKQAVFFFFFSTKKNTLDEKQVPLPTFVFAQCSITISLIYFIYFFFFFFFFFCIAFPFLQKTGSQIAPLWTVKALGSGKLG